MRLDSRLKEIKELADKHGSMRSDDFGHDTHKLLLAEAEALTYWTETAGPMLLEMVEETIKSIGHHGCFCAGDNDGTGASYFCLGHELQRDLEKIAEKYQGSNGQTYNQKHEG